MSYSQINMFSSLRYENDLFINFRLRLKNMAETFIKKFTQISKVDTEIAGGKGSSLGEMTQAGIPVPEGFVILSNAFNRFIEETDLHIEIDAVLDEVDIREVHTVENASEKIQAMILSKEIPEDIKTEILKFYKKLDCKFVAVRSSATSEDSASAAWAGQLDSFLNTTKKTLLENVKKCWASLFTPRAIFYRFEKDLNKDKISVAVVIQKMIESEESGVAFSVHPVTQDKDQIIIEAGFGLGEAIVSGSITPDSYIINKQEFSILDINVNEQTKALYKKTKGGNEWKEIGEKGKKQVLSKNEIIKLSKLITKIENHYRFPCDIEWAKENKKFYILQSRPITTISETETSQTYYKIMTRPLSLIDCECWDFGERIKLPEKFKNLLFFNPLFIYTPKKGVTIYYNFTDPEQNPQPLLNDIEKNLTWFKREKAKFDKNCQKIRALIKNKTSNYKKIANLNHEIWSLIAVANFFGSTEFFKVSHILKNLCIQIREESDDVLHSSLTYLNKLIAKKFKVDTQNISLTEILNNNLPDDVELRKREKGWVFHNGNIIFNIKNYCKENKIQIINPTKKYGNVIYGKIAYKGYVKGKAKVIFELSELSKIKKGDILVTPMTTPEMIPVLKKASAIVTDEGGITCHATIVSRELKIPCVIGTVNASHLISDNDLLEVDANKGSIKIIKKKKGILKK
ncbi:MAG: putative phosphoenolpyruvate synthase [Candidatus Uhrbacteria bacterium GW2011_GWF2_39_13]|uniref:Phosphoenolpyruvate synthase n=1 Tax=Candidatus Uhrbacteria bacterium GW2011_GWF2_39_13 TaxID=1618995 RepID=A0A0G0MWR4_9BACT|nr:MAG: putative phosphoenolpyruvate synthase [Candidatus Uhrbacteria bacterium GW2011_GWF2_39_13]HAU66090.1 hypothetical protein [Candidatus Uhrbacteria bacterium]